MKVPSVKLKDYIVPSYVPSSSSTSLSSSSQSPGITHIPLHSPFKYTMTNYISYSSVPPEHSSFINALNQVVEPTSYTQAAKDHKWVDNLHKEIAALETDHTWSIVPLPSGKRAVGCKWVYKVKYHSNGTKERYKARLVAKGYTRAERIDFQEAFAPIAKMISIRSILAIAAV